MKLGLVLGGIAQGATKTILDMAQQKRLDQEAADLHATAARIQNAYAKAQGAQGSIGDPVGSYGPSVPASSRTTLGQFIGNGFQRNATDPQSSAYAGGLQASALPAGTQLDAVKANSMQDPTSTAAQAAPAAPAATSAPPAATPASSDATAASTAPTSGALDAAAKASTDAPASDDDGGDDA